MNDAAQVHARIQADPDWFCRNFLAFHPWSKQRLTLESVRDHKRTAVRSCHGIGKTAIAARTVLWFLAAYPHSVVITTATTWPQVEKQLWREIAQAFEAAGGFYDGKLTKTGLDLGPDWFALGLSTDKPERFSGFHSENILLVVDEASGVNERIFEAGEGFLTTEGARILLIGNPTQLAGQFYRAFHKEASLWNRIHVSVFDTPAFTGEPVPDHVARSLPEKSWPEKMAELWGDRSGLYAIRVLGDFPVQADDAVCSVGDVERAQLRELPEGRPLVISCDPSRFGDDETVIAVRHGERVRVAAAFTGADNVEVAGRVAAVARQAIADSNDSPVAHVVVDEIGIGAGILDILKRDRRFQVHGFHAARSARQPDKFPLRRDEAWFNFAERLRDGEIDLDPDPQLLEDLVAPVYTFDSKGRRKVEAKDDTKKRLARSPDRADAVLMAFAFSPFDRDNDREIGSQDRRSLAAGVLSKIF